MTTAADLGNQALLALKLGKAAVTAQSLGSWPQGPGLYAVYGSAAVWQTLTLGAPPDDRPLYVGKAERSLASRDVGTHFGFAAGGGNSITGSSTLRRTLSALLRSELGFRGRYRNPARPQKSANFGLSADHDALLSTWMRENLLATYWEMPRVAIPVGDVEKVVLVRLQPPLNIQFAQHTWKSVVKQARAVMAADCGSGG